MGIALLVLTGSVAARPAWIDQGGNPVLRMEYLQGIGLSTATGDPARDQKAADDDARAEIARQIQVQIEDTLRSTIYEVDGKVRSEVKSITQSQVQLLLIGVQIRERYFDEDRKIYYAWAVMDRARNLGPLQAEKEGSLDAAERAKSLFLDTQRVMAGVEWVRHMMKAASLELLCNTIAWETPGAWPVAELLVGAQSQFRTFLQAMKIAPQQTLPLGIFGNSLSEPVQVSLLYEEHPISRTRIRFRFLRGRGLFSEGGTKGEEIVVETDSDGIARCWVTEIQSVTERNRIVAVLDTVGWGLSTGIPLPQCEMNFLSELHPTGQNQELHFALEGSSSEQVFQDGQRVQFTATTNRDGTLHIFQIDALGRLQYSTAKQLDHPETTSSWSIERYGTGWRLTLSVVIRASTGRGLETLVGLWTDPGVQIGQPGQVHMPSELWKQVDQEAGSGRWGVRTLSYEIK